MYTPVNPSFTIYNIPTPAVLRKDAFNPGKVLVISRKQWHRADMKEIVDGDVKHLNTEKQAFGTFKDRGGTIKEIQSIRWPLVTYALSSEHRMHAE